VALAIAARSESDGDGIVSATAAPARFRAVRISSRPTRRSTRHPAARLPAAELVGINTGIYSESGGYQGSGWRSRATRQAVVDDDEVRQCGVSIGYIGSRAGPIAGVGAPNTAPHVEMTRDSEVYDAGLRPGDIIITFNGQTVTDPSHLNRLVLDAKIGSTATVVVLREGRRIEFKLPIVSTSSRGRR
jgi:serine protease Do